jgi:hypothetical protein
MEDISIKLFEAIWDFWVGIWWELPFKTAAKLLGLYRPDKTKIIEGLYFDDAYYKMLTLREKLKILYDSPRSIDADSLSLIISLYTQIECFRTLASRGMDWGIKTLDEDILWHEKLLKRIEKESKSGVREAAQVAISKAMIESAKNSAPNFRKTS